MILFMITCSTGRTLTFAFSLGLAAAAAHHPARASGSAGSAHSTASAGSAAVRHRVVERLLVGREERVKGRVGLAVDRGQLSVERAGGRRELIDRGSVVGLHGVA